ncbi:MAG: selenoneine biosynthesis selenosugar synthase SenB [Betaproteobacteria bacterium]
MKIAIVTPAPPRSRHGNRHTAIRWAAFARKAGQRVVVQSAWDGAPVDLMIALHARRSHDSMRRYKEVHSMRPLVLVLTGTDIYRDIRRDSDAKRSLRIADRLVVLQEQALARVPRALRHKVRVIYQSAKAPVAREPARSRFEVVVSGHLRPEKDPFRAAAALAHLPQQSAIRVLHMGAAMDADMEREARQWTTHEPRYRWLGEVSHAEAMRRLARSRLMVISSRMEGGANVVAEALMAGVPVIASRIPGNVGMLGRNYAGYFPVENEKALARLLWRAESDPAFYRRLKGQCSRRRALFEPEREARSLRRLLRELASAGTAPNRDRRGATRR